MSAGGQTSFAVLRGIDASRLANLIRRLSSDHDGEVIASVNAIRRTLARAGQSLHDLADLVEANVRDAQCDAAAAAWRRDVDELMRRRKQLTDWELRFVKTVSRYRHQPSAKQLDVLAGIRRRLEEDAAHAA